MVFYAVQVIDIPGISICANVGRFVHARQSAVGRLYEASQSSYTLQRDTMHYGIYVPNFDTFGNAQILADLANEAEAMGWDGFFLWDHLFGDADAQNAPVADPWICLAAIAAKTQRIRLGALVTPFARRRPWKLAREAVTLDHLSNGRLIVGAGIGGDWWREYSAFGEAPDYKINDARFLPPPKQQPRIPIWVAGWWPGTRPFRRAARWDGIVPNGGNGDLSPADVQAMRVYVQSHRKTDAPFDVVVGGRTWEKELAVASETVAQYEAAGATWWLESFWSGELGEARAAIRRGPPQSKGM